jgi:hypothetical protein
MKHSKLLIWSALAVMVLSAIPAFAQGRETKYNIPFSFNVGKEVRPSGPYVVASVFETSLLIRRTDGTGAIVVFSMPVVSPDRASPCKLVFRRYGNKYFLSQAWLGIRSSGQELFRSDEEKEMARNLKAQEQIIVAEK